MRAVKTVILLAPEGRLLVPMTSIFLVSCTHEIRSGRDGAHRCIRSGAFFAGSEVRVKKNFVSRSRRSKARCARSEVSRFTAATPRFKGDPRRSREAGCSRKSTGTMSGMQCVAARRTGRQHVHQAPACASGSGVRSSCALRADRLSQDTACSRMVQHRRSRVPVLPL